MKNDNDKNEQKLNSIGLYENHFPTKVIFLSKYKLFYDITFNKNI